MPLLPRSARLPNDGLYPAQGPVSHTLIFSSIDSSSLRCPSRNPVKQSPVTSWEIFTSNWFWLGCFAWRLVLARRQTNLHPKE